MTVELTRRTLNFKPKTQKALEALMERTEGNITDVIQSAVEWYDKVQGEVAKGAVLTLERPDGTSYRLMMF